MLFHLLLRLSPLALVYQLVSGLKLSSIRFSPYVSKSSSASSTSLQVDLLNDFPISTTIASAVGLYGVATFASYTKMQYVTASMVSGVPSNSKVVEIDVQDGKNIFYLSSNCDYTAVMSLGDDPKKQIEKANYNERVILESIGKANANNLNLKGKVRSRTQDVPSRSADCVLCVGGLARAGINAPEVLQEVLRVLRPGGLFVFVEPDRTLGVPERPVTELIKQVFPEEIKVVSPQSPQAQSRAKAESGNSAASLSIAEEEAFMRSRGKKDSRKTRGQKSGGTVLMDKTSQLPPSGSTDASSGSESADSTSTEVDPSNSNSSSSQPKERVFVVSEGSKSGLKPGLVYETHNNLLNKYVSGIAVKPY